MPLFKRIAVIFVVKIVKRNSGGGSKSVLMGPEKCRNIVETFGAVPQHQFAYHGNRDAGNLKAERRAKNLLQLI